MNSFYEIRRGVKSGKTLTTAQRSSSKFAEEPVVLGKVLRAGSRPMRISEDQYLANKTHLVMLEKAGAISVVNLKEPKKSGHSILADLKREQEVDRLLESLNLSELTPPAIETPVPTEAPSGAPEETKLEAKSEEIQAPELKEEAKVDSKVAGKKGKRF